MSADVLPEGGGSVRTFYRVYWPDFVECGTATSDPMPEPGSASAGTVTYPLYLVAGPEIPLYLFQSTSSQYGPG